MDVLKPYCWTEETKKGVVAASNNSDFVMQDNCLIEYELKARTNGHDVTALLQRTKSVGNKQECDQYYDTTSALLFQQGIFIRIRNNSRLDIKYNPNTADSSHTSCHEANYVWPLSNRDSVLVRNFLQSHIGELDHDPAIDTLGHFGLTEFVCINKTRSIFQGDGYTICLDNVDDLGCFVELETNERAIYDWIRNLASSHGLIEINTGYVELYLREHDYDLYKKGRYLLISDQTTIFS